MVRKKYIAVPAGEDSHFKVGERVHKLEQELGRVVEIRYVGSFKGVMPSGLLGKLDKYKVLIEC